MLRELTFKDYHMRHSYLSPYSYVCSSMHDIKICINYLTNYGIYISMHALVKAAFLKTHGLANCCGSYIYLSKKHNIEIIIKVIIDLICKNYSSLQHSCM